MKKAIGWGLGSFLFSLGFGVLLKTNIFSLYLLGAASMSLLIGSLSYRADHKKTQKKQFPTCCGSTFRHCGCGGPCDDLATGLNKGKNKNN